MANSNGFLAPKKIEMGSPKITNTREIMSLLHGLIIYIGGLPFLMTGAGANLIIGGPEPYPRINKAILIVGAAAVVAKSLKRQFQKMEDELDTIYSIGFGTAIALTLYKLRLNRDSPVS